ncbi:toll/interleukin-1 receptor domain-containing protein [Neorhizobium tomejilense]|uniref:toll/interleukin-1 receptor domain-containing protein n=1 Tax=Neorhizobium tomejilense TaxID=2093828 RepID=UPI000CF95E8B|nr:toll/interleukin-1 receptor domain-containing protein [Neorhizobium tomejilense]
MVDIFISHCVVDKKLAEKFVSFLKEAVGVPAKAIFCSSVGGHDIPLTVDFNQYMKDKIKKPKLVITLMTPRYMESWFCLMELGAAWSLSHKTLPIVVPPIKFNVVSSTLGLTQAWSLDNHDKLIHLRQTIRELDIQLENRTEQDWEKKRTAWKADLKRLLKDLAPASNVPASEHATLTEQLKIVEQERDSFEELYTESQVAIEELALLKNKDEAKAVLKKHGGKDAEEGLGDLISDVASFQQKWMTKSFFIDMIMDHRGKPSSINWYDADVKSMAETAIQKNYLDENPPHNVLWGGKLKKLSKALEAVDMFLSGESLEQLDEDTPTDSTDREFWEYHLG